VGHPSGVGKIRGGTIDLATDPFRMSLFTSASNVATPTMSTI
jgi:hypothetical protein